MQIIGAGHAMLLLRPGRPALDQVRGGGLHVPPRRRHRGWGVWHRRHHRHGQEVAHRLEDVGGGHLLELPGRLQLSHQLGQLQVEPADARGQLFKLVLQTLSFRSFSPVVCSQDRL